MSRRRKTNHLKPRTNTNRPTAPKPRRQSPPGLRPTLVVSFIDDTGELIDIDVSNDPEIAELLADLSHDCPYCNHEGEH